MVQLFLSVSAALLLLVLLVLIVERILANPEQALDTFVARNLDVPALECIHSSATSRGPGTARRSGHGPVPLATRRPDEGAR